MLKERSLQAAFALALEDLRRRYKGHALGLFWMIAQPLAMILIIWIVFRYGFRTAAVTGVDFAVWLSVGMIAWLYFLDTVTQLSEALEQYRFIVTKSTFPISSIFVAKALAALIPHLILLAMVLALAWVSGYEPRFAWVELLYYLGSLAIFGGGIGLIVGSVAAFLPDIRQMMNMILQGWFWLTPVFWSASQAGESLPWWIWANPLYYPVEGYREAIFGSLHFWERSEGALFWGVCVVLWIGAIYIYRRLRAHFADVL